MRVVKNVYLEQVCFNIMKGSKKGSESANEEIASEHNVDCVFRNAEVIIHHEIVPEEQTVNGNFFIKKLIALVHRVTFEFQKNESWYLQHDSTPARVLGVVSLCMAKRGILCYPLRPTPQI
jgi:hypothetical protein